jgi:hypothetical protein
MENMLTNAVASGKKGNNMTGIVWMEFNSMYIT